MRYTAILAASLAALLALAACTAGKAKAYNDSGVAYIKLGEHRRAIEDFDQALRLDPGEPIGYVNRGAAYANLGEYHRAIENFDQALRLDSNSSGGYHNRGSARCQLGQVEASLDDWMDWMQVPRLGASFDAAESFQRTLRDHGFYKGAINGDFGPSSQKALREWTVAGCPGVYD
jgi:tetratricopeptide (TPR) repeat protein